MEYNKPPSPPATTTATSRARENLKSLLVKCAIASNQKAITTDQETLMEKRIEELLPTFHTPDHPPYAWMIENAIVKLNEEGGSSEGAISNFILEECKDLPWAHAALLKYHLRRLCEIGHLVECCEGYYRMESQRTNITYKGNPKPLPIFTYAASPSPSTSTSPYTSFSSSSTYASSCSSTSSQSFCMEGKKRKRLKESFRAHCQGRRGKGRGRGRGKDQGRGRGRGKGRGRDRVWRQGGYAPPLSGKKKMKRVCDTQSEDEVESAGAQCLMARVDNLDENIQEFDQVDDNKNQGSVDIESQANLIEIAPPEQQCGVNDKNALPLQQESVVSTENGSTPCTVARSHKKSGCENRNVRPGKGRGRPCKRVLKVEESETNISLEVTEVGALEEGSKEKNKDKGQLKEDQSYLPVTEACHISDDATVPEKLTHDFPPVTKGSFAEENIDYASQVEQHEGGMLDELIDEVCVDKSINGHGQNDYLS